MILTLQKNKPVTNFAIRPAAQPVSDLKAGLQYMNVHSNIFPNGETRGQLLWNPTLEENFFVRQHYLDFLGRYPIASNDAGGLAVWSGKIADCKADAGWLHNETIET